MTNAMTETSLTAKLECFVLDPNNKLDGPAFVVKVVEDEAGFVFGKRPVSFGTREEAQQWCDTTNAQMGVDEYDVDSIMSSSVKAQCREDLATQGYRKSRGLSSEVAAQF